MKSFSVETPVKGEIGIDGRHVSFDFAVGVVSPKNSDEEAILLRLVDLGLAKVGSAKVSQPSDKQKAVEADEKKEG